MDAKIYEINFRAKHYGLCATDLVIVDSDSDREERMKKAILEILREEYFLPFEFYTPL